MERFRALVRIVVAIAVIDDFLIAVAQSGIEYCLEQFQVHDIAVGAGIFLRAQKGKALR